MAPPFLRILLGVVSLIGGALVAYNPAPPGFRRSHSLPATGVILIAGAIWMIVAAWRDHRDAKTAGNGRHTTGRPPRHAAHESRTSKIRLWAGLAVATPASCWMLWWGMDSGYLSLVGLGTIGIAFSVVALITLLLHPDSG
ncbi:hypothetical protein [Mycobacterium branderi]|uniref:DUF3180 domain-containing protein n=1 Tax=Mycobacterium branderi TaxID=43348 RepID=A0A7I7WC41_9MYCO|nr:hypothetical protein [Mycobacterium branderi]MCV7236274.1 hypothetical protein [Mycobacterium branderi]ORA35449.1 hypothetical protein BST20_17820 [Mycobacterium branderi]BBZ15156.1 hypothetical protein MBRA_53510 [Mycobacterium branderi]